MFPEDAYFTALAAVPSAEELPILAERIFAQVFRTDFTAPGFALLRLPVPVTSQPLRRFLVALKEALGELYAQRFGQQLIYLSLARFDQQVTTKFHLDGAPAASFLMLGYEPSAVDSTVALADYSQAAYALGITPAQFLTDYNPMFSRGAQQLEPYITRLTTFAPDYPQVLLINNSFQPYEPGQPHHLGVMHQATVPQPSAQRRLVNSIMLSAASAGVNELVTAAEVQHFQDTDEAARKYGG